MCLRHIHVDTIYSKNYNSNTINNSILIDEFTKTTNDDYTKYKNNWINYKIQNSLYWKHLEIIVLNSKNYKLNSDLSNKNNLLSYSFSVNSPSDYYFSRKYNKSIKFFNVKKFEPNYLILIVYYSYFIVVITNFIRQMYIANVIQDILISILNIFGEIINLGLLIFLTIK